MKNPNAQDYLIRTLVIKDKNTDQIVDVLTSHPRERERLRNKVH